MTNLLHQRVVSLDPLSLDLGRECASLRAENQQLREVLQAIFGALVVTDALGCIELVNQATLALLGYQEQELVGKPLSLILEAERRPAAEEFVDRLLVSKEEQVYVCKDGRRRDVLFSVTPLLDREVQIRGMVCMAHDLGERNRLEAELRHAQRMESIGTLAAGLAHEINTPVQYIGDNLRFLREALDDLLKLIARIRQARPELAETLHALEAEVDLTFLDVAAPKACEAAREGVERIAAIVRAVKQFARPDDRHKVPVDLNEVVRNCLLVAHSQYRPFAEVDLVLDELPLVDCLVGDVGQVIVNLLVNAAHAIARKPGVGARGHITVATGTRHGKAIIAISDTGCGIADEIRGRIFDPFFTTKEVGRGTGQGLAIARTIIVDQHGGELWFDSEVGVGTTFYVSLPVGRHLD